MNRSRQANPARVSAELRETITGLLAAGQGGSPVTLQQVRLALQRNSSAWTQEGEVLHPQDRTSLLIEIDELIEKHGKDVPARDFLPVGPSKLARKPMERRPGASGLCDELLRNL